MEVRTALQTGDTQSLSGVQRQAVVAVLDVRLAGHGVEVGLQGELHQVVARLHLQQGSTGENNMLDFRERNCIIPSFKKGGN